MLRPRGPMKKESLGATILERLLSAHESWTNPEYGDNPSEKEVIDIIENNLREEAYYAFKEFSNQVKKN